MTRTTIALLALAALTIPTRGAAAHEIGTTRVTVHVTATGTYRVEVVTDAAALAEKLEMAAGRQPPAADASPAHLQQILRAGARTLAGRVELAFDGTAAAAPWTVAVAPAADSLSAPTATLRSEGPLPAGARSLSWRYGWTFASYALAVTPDGAVADPIWLEGDDTRVVSLTDLPAPPTRLAVAGRYLVLGFTHILPLGLDHVLFVLGLYLLSRRTRVLLWQVSAFTLAHTLTLALSMFGIVSVSPRVIEPLIALSIAYVAIENLLLTELRPWRVGLVFGFGLLHGLGFAGALQELGLPRSEFVTALLSFNAGVEAGQLTVIALAAGLVGWHCATRSWYRSRIVVPASLVIACTALYWTIERLAR